MKNSLMSGEGSFHSIFIEFVVDSSRKHSCTEGMFGGMGAGLIGFGVVGWMLCFRSTFNGSRDVSWTLKMPSSFFPEFTGS